MAIAIGVDQIGTGSGTAIASAAATTTASGSIFVVAGCFNGTFTSVTDSKSNSYSIVGAERVVDTSAASGRMYYVENGTGGASHTATVTDNSATIKTVLFAEITGALTSGALDVSNSATDASSPFTVAVTPTAGVRLLVAAFFGDTAGATTNAESSGFTILTTANLNDGSTFYAGCLAYRLVTADGSTAYTASFTQTGANEGGVWLAAFKEAASGPPTISSATPSGTLTTTTTATLGATSDQSSGTFFWVVGPDGTVGTPTGAQIEAGQYSSGSTAAFSGSETVTRTALSDTVSGLTGNTIYDFAVVHESAGGYSNILTGSFTTGPTAELEGFRFRNDDGSESTATWKAAQDTNLTEVSGTVRLRVLVNFGGDRPSQMFKLQYRKVGNTDWSDMT